MGPPRERNGRPLGRPENVVLEEPNEKQDDDDEREKSATDVHSGLLCAVDVGTTAQAEGRLRTLGGLGLLATMSARVAPWPSG